MPIKHEFIGEAPTRKDAIEHLVKAFIADAEANPDASLVVATIIENGPGGELMSSARFAGLTVQHACSLARAMLSHAALLAARCDCPACSFQAASLLALVNMIGQERPTDARGSMH